MVNGDCTMRTIQHLQFALAVSLLSLGTARGEQYLAKGDARVLGNKEDEATFKTCRGNRVEFKDVPGYELIDTADRCDKGGGTINSIGSKEERQIIERMKRDPDRVVPKESEEPQRAQ